MYAKDTMAGPRGVQDGLDQPADEEVVACRDEDGGEHDEGEGGGERALRGSAMLWEKPGQALERGGGLALETGGRHTTSVGLLMEKHRIAYPTTSMAAPTTTHVKNQARYLTTVR